MEFAGAGSVQGESGGSAADLGRAAPQASRAFDEAMAQVLGLLDARPHAPVHAAAFAAGRTPDHRPAIPRRQPDDSTGAQADGLPAAAGDGRNTAPTDGDGGALRGGGSSEPRRAAEERPVEGLSGSDPAAFLPPAVDTGPALGSGRASTPADRAPETPAAPASVTVDFPDPTWNVSGVEVEVLADGAVDLVLSVEQQALYKVSGEVDRLKRRLEAKGISVGSIQLDAGRSGSVTRASGR